MWQADSGMCEACGIDVYIESNKGTITDNPKSRTGGVAGQNQQRGTIL